MRVIGIDYGRKRSGLAVTDPLQIVAGPLATVPTASLLDYIRQYVAAEQVEAIVIGEPRRLNGEPSESARYISPFVERLRRELPPEIKIVEYDERFTSTLAHRAMIQGGMKKSDRRDKAQVDRIAATIILNDYLQSRQFTDDTNR